MSSFMLDFCRPAGYVYLNMIGKEAVLKHISKCWASLLPRGQ